MWGGGSRSGAAFLVLWPLRRVSMKIEKRKIVTKKVFIFTDKDPSTRQGGRPMTLFRNCLTTAKIWS